MPDVHARFSPSSAERLIHCPPSLVLGEEAGPEDNSTEYTAEGTEAHRLCEYLLKSELGEMLKDPRSELNYYSPEMEDCANGYKEEVMSIYEQLRQSDPETLISVEQRVGFTEYVKDAFGTSDCIIVGNGHLYVIDYKHGKGVPVSAEGEDQKGNPQLKCYGLGAYLAFAPLYEIEDITLVVYQPRISNYSQYTLTPEELLTWAETELKPAAEKALRGEGEYACGSWCRFCKAKAVCRKRAEENLSLAKYDFAPPDRLEEDEINEILGKLESLKSWAEDIKEYAMQKALSGYAWADWKLVEGRSNRAFTDEEEAARLFEEAGFDPYERKVKSLTAMETAMGKKQFREKLGGLVIKPQGKPTLVSRKDKREEIKMEENE